MRSKRHMLGRLVLLSGACASAAAENVVGSTKSIEKKKNRLGSSSSRRVLVHGLNEEDDVQADGDHLSFTVFQRMKREGVHLQEDVPRHMHAPVASHDVGVLSSKGDEEEVDTLLSREHRGRRRRAKMNSSHLPHDVDVSTNDGGYDKVEEDVQHAAKMEEVRAIFSCCWMSEIFQSVPCDDDVIRIYRTITYIRLLPSIHTHLYMSTVYHRSTHYVYHN